MNVIQVILIVEDPNVNVIQVILIVEDPTVNVIQVILIVEDLNVNVIQVILIVEDPNMTVKCRTAIKVLFLKFVSKCNVGQSHILIHPYSFLQQAVPLL